MKRRHLTRNVLGPVADALTEAGVEWRLEPGGRHASLVIQHQGIERRVVLPGSPSDARSIDNSRADVRRVCREMGITLPRA